MLKRILSMGIIGIILTLLLNPIYLANDEQILLLDVNQNNILVGTNIDSTVPVASISKMMTEYLFFEQIEGGNIDWDDMVEVSRDASGKEGAKINLTEGDIVPVRDLYMAMLLPSANNATVALAEYLEGSETAFTEKMNQKAKELGLLNSNFVNATGLTEINNKSNQMSLRDIAKLAQRLISDFPQVLQDTSTPSYILNFSEELIHTTNHMLTKPGLGFDGLDGLKTGYTNEAGYCFVGTAVRNDQRYITVVLGSENYDSRFIETQKLLSTAFN